ncbi:hypothetical protein EDB86DRAFT_2831319 [Lactarius hatsudake]|nr:hypothetical protein EDB86DRAFT_2831319 [Lactarius hatsudake]
MTQTSPARSRYIEQIDTNSPAHSRYIDSPEPPHVALRGRTENHLAQRKTQKTAGTHADASSWEPERRGIYPNAIAITGLDNHLTALVRWIAIHGESQGLVKRRHPKNDLAWRQLALTLIQGPQTAPWKRTVRRGRTNGWVDESVWDEFFDSFCTVWIDEAPMTQAPFAPAPINSIKFDFAPSTIDPAPVSSPLPATLLTPVDEPLASVPAATDPPIPVPVGILEPAMTPSTTDSVSPPPRPPRSPHHPDDSVQTSPLPPVTETERKETPFASAPASPTCDFLSPLNPIVASTPTSIKENGEETPVSQVIPTLTLLNIPAMPHLEKRKQHATSDSDELRPCKDAFPPHRATTAHEARTLSFPAPTEGRNSTRSQNPTTVPAGQPLNQIKCPKIIPPASPLDPTATRRCEDRHTHHTEITETVLSTTGRRNRANAAVREPLGQQDAIQATSRPNPAYNAVTEHLALCLARDPDNTRITQPFMLNLEPSTILRRCKAK